jgi:hypothetical protein
LLLPWLLQPLPEPQLRPEAEEVQAEVLARVTQVRSPQSTQLTSNTNFDAAVAETD